MINFKNNTIQVQLRRGFSEDIFANDNYKKLNLKEAELIYITDENRLAVCDLNGKPHKIPTVDDLLGIDGGSMDDLIMELIDKEIINRDLVTRNLMEGYVRHEISKIEGNTSGGHKDTISIQDLDLELQNQINKIVKIDLLEKRLELIQKELSDYKKVTNGSIESINDKINSLDDDLSIKNIGDLVDRYLSNNPIGKDNLSTEILELLDKIDNMTSNPGGEGSGSDLDLTEVKKLLDEELKAYRQKSIPITYSDLDINVIETIKNDIDSIINEKGLLTKDDKIPTEKLEETVQELLRKIEVFDESEFFKKTDKIAFNNLTNDLQDLIESKNGGSVELDEDKIKDIIANSTIEKSQLSQEIIDFIKTSKPEIELDDDKIKELIENEISKGLSDYRKKEDKITKEDLDDSIFDDLETGVTIEDLDTKLEDYRKKEDKITKEDLASNVFDDLEVGVTVEDLDDKLEDYRKKDDKITKEDLNEGLVTELNDKVAIENLDTKLEDYRKKEDKITKEELDEDFIEELDKFQTIEDLDTKLEDYRKTSDKIAEEDLTEDLKEKINKEVEGGSTELPKEVQETLDALKLESEKQRSRQIYDGILANGIENYHREIEWEIVTRQNKGFNLEKVLKEHGKELTITDFYGENFKLDYMSGDYGGDGNAEANVIVLSRLNEDLPFRPLKRSELAVDEYLPFLYGGLGDMIFGAYKVHVFYGNLQMEFESPSTANTELKIVKFKE